MGSNSPTSQAAWSLENSPESAANTTTAAVPSEFGMAASASSTKTTSESSGSPLVGATSLSSAANTVKDNAAKINPISRVTHAVLGPVMNLISALMPPIYLGDCLIFAQR